jgi:hypothetical protein
MLTQGHVRQGFSRVDAERFSAARGLPLCATPSLARRRHSAVTRGQLAQSKLWSGRLCQGLRGVWLGTVALGVCAGVLTRVGARGHVGPGELTHVLGPSARVGSHAAGYIHDPPVYHWGPHE